MLMLLSAAEKVHPYDEAAKIGVITVLQGMGIVFSVLVTLMLIISFTSLINSFFAKKPEVSANKTPSIGSMGELIIEGVEDDATIALIIAIVAYNTGLDSEHLKLKSIKLLKD